MNVFKIIVEHMNFITVIMQNEKNQMFVGMLTKKATTIDEIFTIDLMSTT